MLLVHPLSLHRSIPYDAGDDASQRTPFCECRMQGSFTLSSMHAWVRGCFRYSVYLLYSTKVQILTQVVGASETCPPRCPMRIRRAWFVTSLRTPSATPLSPASTLRARLFSAAPTFQVQQCLLHWYQSTNTDAVFATRRSVGNDQRRCLSRSHADKSEARY